ncbi:Prp31 C-terminal [Sesbania bispinosa]|nr:Prp31 C-terminal [Sesbania bispinosa]
MATLADSFLADLDELSDNEAEIPEENDVDAADMEEDIDGDLADLENLNYDDLDSVSKLQKTQRYIDIMQYRLKFPELESLVHHPIDYARVVKKIGNETDLTLVDLEGLLPSAIIMVVSVTASTTTGKPLPEEVLSKTIEACDRALALDSAKKKVLDFVESRMGYIAPNLSAIVGSAVAAKLMGTAGGLAALAKMPACNVQLLGAKKKNLAGFSTATSQFRVGYLEQTEIFQTTPPPLRMRACRLLAAKSTLAARVDSIRGDPSGNNGRAFKDEIRKKIEKWQEPPPAKQPKPLPVPDSEPKKKRGGRRLRKMKERYAITDMRKLANRMQFGVPEESSLGIRDWIGGEKGDGLGEGYGMLGQAGSGKLRVSIGQSRLAAKVAKKFKEKNYGSSGATSGLTSSLAFTPVQGIELTNPQAHAHQLGSGTQSTYFSETGTFSKIKRT